VSLVRFLEAPLKAQKDPFDRTGFFILSRTQKSASFTFLGTVQNKNPSAARTFAFSGEVPKELAQPNPAAKQFFFRFRDKGVTKPFLHFLYFFNPLSKLNWSILIITFL
jgi:hypothetical protein